MLYLVGAFYLAFSTPVALAFSSVPNQVQDVTPTYLKPISADLKPLIMPIEETPPIPVKTVVAPPKPAQAVSPVVPTGCTVWHSGDSTIDTLINRESGGNTCATNAGGCYGILQACPGYPLRAACGGDGVCQLAWFEANKLGRYGSWSAALQHSYQFGWW